MNVKFYKITGNLPTWTASHKGIFVWAPANAKPGLWFGGESAWEYLTNSDADINTLIDAKINALDVTEFPLATESNGVVTIKGIKETDGKIAVGTDTSKDVTLDKVATTGAAEDVDFDSTYSGSTISATNVQKAIEELDGDIQGISSTISGLNATNIQGITHSADADGDITVTLKGITQTNGQISQGSGTDTFVVGNANLNITDGTNNASVFTANAATDATLTLGNGLVFDSTTKTISVNANDTVSASNKVATMNDIATLNGAMHYKGAMAADSDWPQTTVAGDVYVVTTGFTHSGTTLETGDMVVFNNATGDYNVVQTNMTIGVGQGQVAANSAALTSGNIVVASSTGVETTAYTPATIASQSTTVSSSNGTVTVTDTLTVGGTGQTGESFTITGTDGVSVSAANNAITLDLDIDGTYDASNNKIATQSTVSTAINDLDATVTQYGKATGNGASESSVDLTITETNGKLTSVDCDLVWIEDATL